MTRDDIIQLARKANISVMENNSFADDMYISVLYRFAHLVVAHEREQCARVCDAFDKYVAAAIRAREQKEQQE